MRYKAVLFDFDGTIADTSQGIFESIQYAMEHMRMHSLSLEQMRKFIGPPLQHSFRTVAGMSEAQTEKAVEYYREFYEEGEQYRLQIYPGIPELLRDLRANGYLVGLASAKPDLFIQQIIERFSLHSLFDFAEGVSLDESYTDKSALILHVLKQLHINDPQEALMIGDRKYDVDGAHKAGAHAAGILYGVGTKSELKTAGAEYILQTVNDLRAFLL